MFDALRKHKLFCKFKKCEFALSSIQYLGYVVENGCYKPDPAKVDSIVNFPVPRNVTEVRSFLGLVNFYRKFIRNCAAIAKPLTTLTRKDVSFVWDSKCQVAFDSLKGRITSAPVLILPDPTLPYIIHCDASDFAVGAVL